MKKPLKTVLIVCCLALLLFLLLPFLETKAPQPGGQNGTAKAEPQIFTSNPLADLVGRIARFFRAGQPVGGPAADDPMTAERANELFGQPQEDVLYASAQTAENSSQENTFQADGAAYANAYFQNEDGEWVLIRQTAPEGASRGMHEINVKDNAYDRYVHQERQARFTPVMRTPKAKEEVPDSKLARVFNPIKRLFGFGSAAASGPLSADGRFAAGTLTSSSGLDKNKEKRSTLPRNRAIDWNSFDANLFSSDEPGGVDATQKLANFILPDAELNRMADWLADVKYPNAENDPGAQQEKENFKEQQREKNRQQFVQEAAKIMEGKAQKPEENILAETMQFTCGDQVVSVKKNSCEIEEESLETYRESNAAYFYEKTNLHLPPAMVTVVLQKTGKEIPTVESINQERQEWTGTDLPPEAQQAVNMYHFMQESCPDCYWVATGANQAQELQQTIEAAGLTFKGDPLERHQQHIQNYLAQQQENGMQPEKLKELGKNLRDNPTPYTAYTQEDLQQMHQDVLNLFKKKDGQARPEDTAVPFFTQANTASQYYNDTGRQHPLFYGTGTATQEGSLKDRSQALTEDIADFVNGWQAIIRDIKQENVQEGAADMARPKIQQIGEQLKQDMKNFDAANDLGRTQK